jgi:transposase-like protein
MEEKLRFVFEYEQGEYSMTELCERREISRETGYVWLRRYRKHGLAGLVERARAAHRHPNHTAAELEGISVELRQALTFEELQKTTCSAQERSRQPACKLLILRKTRGLPHASK